MPDNISEHEEDHIEAFKVFLSTGDYSTVARIPEGELRLLRIKYTQPSLAFAQQLIDAMDHRIAQIERERQSRRDWIRVIASAVLGSVVGVGATLTTSHLASWNSTAGLKATR